MGNASARLKRKVRQKFMRTLQKADAQERAYEKKFKAFKREKVGKM